MAYVYLIQNGDLFKIGRTEHLERRLKQLQPGRLVQAGQTNRSRDLEYELHQRFKSVRIPQTEYFRLNDYQVEEVRVALGWAKPQPLPPASENYQTHGCKIGKSTATERHNRLKDAYLKQVEEQKEIDKERILSGDSPDLDDWWRGERREKMRIQRQLKEQEEQELIERKREENKDRILNAFIESNPASASRMGLASTNGPVKEQKKEPLTEPEREQVRKNMQKLSMNTNNGYGRWPNN